jgi:hypothetical protein
MKRAALLLTATLLAGCATTDTPASYAPMPVTYGAGMRSMDSLTGNPPMLMPYTPLRQQSVDVYVHQAPGPVPMLQHQVLQPLRPVTLRPLN